MKKIKLLALNGLIVGTTILAPITVLTSCKKEEEKKKPVYIDYVQTNVDIVDNETSGVIKFKLDDLKSTDLTVSNMKIESSSEGVYGARLGQINVTDKQGNGFIEFNIDIYSTAKQDEWVKISFDISGKSDETEWTYHVDGVTINRIISVLFVGDSKEISTNPGLTYAQFSFKFGKNKIPKSLDDVEIIPIVNSSSNITVSYNSVYSTLNKLTGEALIAFNLENAVDKYLADGDSAQFGARFKSESLDFNTLITDFELTYSSGIASYDQDVSTKLGVLSAEYEFTFQQDFQNPAVEVGFVGDVPPELSQKITYRFDEERHNVIYFTVSAISERDIEPQLGNSLPFNLSINIKDSKTQECLLLERVNGMSYTYMSNVHCDDEDRKEIATSLVGEVTESVPFVFTLIGETAEFKTGDELTVKVFKTESSSTIEVHAEQIATPTSGSDFNVAFYLKPEAGNEIQSGDYCKFNIELTLISRGEEQWTQPMEGFSLYYISEP